jgi:signal transduction histidine kinase
MRVRMDVIESLAVIPIQEKRPSESSREKPHYMPRWIAALLRVPLIGKIAGANAIIAAAAVLVARFGHLVSDASGLWLVLIVALGLGMAVNAVLVYVALRPLQELETTARRVWQGELDSRVPPSPVADAGIQRVGNTLNILLDGVSADQARLRTLANQVIQAGDRERASLARELHDSTAQTLTALLLELSVLAGENSDPRLDDRITRVRAIVSDVLDEVRMLAHTVHPRVLDDLGLAAALQLLARETIQRSSVSVNYDGPAKVEGLDASSASALYRIAQEAVGNAIRHARAESVAVHLREGVSDIELEISDDGVGFSPDEVERRRPGMGLFTMRERAALVGGRLTVKSTNGKGTRVVAHVPRVAASPAPMVGATTGAGNPWQRKEDV